MAMDKQIVKTTSLFAIDDTFDDDRFCRVRIAAMHSGKNRNGSSFDLKVIEDAKDTFANIPVLAEIREHEDKDGNKYLDYGSHAMHVEEDYFDNDELRMIYDEKVVGLVPEANNFEIVHDDETGNDYVYVDALLYRDYGNYCCDILEQRGGKTDVSMEINCPEISVDAYKQTIVVNKMKACAITLLGEDVQPGMAKANAQVFSLNENDRQNQLIELLSELNEKLDSFNINSIGKEDAKVKKVFEDEVAEEATDTSVSEAAETEDISAGDTPEDVIYEATKKKKKAEDDDSVIVDDEEEPTQNETPTADETPNTPEPEEPEETPEQQEEETPTDNQEPEDTNYYSIDYTVSVNGEKKTYAVSLKEKLNALTSLVNETYGESDGAWYDVDVIEDSKTVEFHDWWNNKHYRQSYSVKKDVYSLKGDRTETFVSFLTADEKTALEQMKSNYSAIEIKLANYEAEPQKQEILNAECYAQVKDTEEFKKLAEQSEHFEMTIEDVQKKADEILLTYAKAGKVEFAAEDQPRKVIGMKMFGDANKKTTKGQSRYGSLFAKNN